MRAGWLAVLLAVLGGCAPGGPGQADTVSIPLAAGGVATTLQGRVCRPSGPGAARVVVIAHGSPPVAADRATQRLTSCDNEAVRWFTGRGYLVALSLRRGYGATGGAYRESSAGCGADAYERAARTAAEDVAATLDYALALPGVRPDRPIVVGQSAGGWATLGVNAGPHRAAALVSMAGGRGGHMDNVPHRNCRPENLVAAAGQLGRTATTPMLWIYTANDSFFAPDLAARMHQAFTAAGGKAELLALPGFGTDGHRLFFSNGGSAIWGPLVERYLTQQDAS